MTTLPCKQVQGIRLEVQHLKILFVRKTKKTTCKHEREIPTLPPQEFCDIYHTAPLHARAGKSLNTYAGSKIVTNVAAGARCAENYTNVLSLVISGYLRSFYTFLIYFVLVHLQYTPPAFCYMSIWTQRNGTL